MEKSDFDLQARVEKARGHTVGSPARTIALSEISGYLSIARVTPNLLVPILGVIELYIAEVSQADDKTRARLDKLSQLCGAIARAQLLPGIQSASEYQSALDSSEWAAIDLAPELRYQLDLARTSGDRAAQSQLMLLMRRLFRHLPRIERIRELSCWRELYELTFRLQAAIVCQYAGSERAMQARRRQESDKLIQLIETAGIFIGNPDWKRTYDYCYEEALIEAKVYSCHEYPERYEPDLGELQHEFRMVCDRSADTLSWEDFRPLLDRVRRSGWAVKEKNHAQQWDAFQQEAKESPNKAAVAKLSAWLAELDESQDAQRSYKRVLIWLGLLTWDAAQFRPTLISFPVWIGNNLWRILQKLKARRKANKETVLLPPDALARSLEDMTQNATALEVSVRERWRALLALVEADREQRLSQIHLKKYPAVTAQVSLAYYLRYQRAAGASDRRDISLNEVIEAMTVELGLATPDAAKPFKNMVAKVTYFFKTKCVPELERLWERC